MNALRKSREYFRGSNRVKTAGKIGVVGFIAALSANSSFAALPAAIALGITEIQTDGLALVDLIWPAVIALTSAFLLFKFFKRGTSKI